MTDDPNILKLKEPIKHGSETISELVFRKPKAKDFRSVPMEPNMGDILNLVGKLSGQPPSVIDELGTEDMMEACAKVSGFFPAGLGTGKTP